jgi:hypothetical protein
VRGSSHAREARCVSRRARRTRAGAAAVCYTGGCDAQRREHRTSAGERGPVHQRARHPARALVIRTLPNTADKAARDYTLASPPYLSREAAQLLVSRGILHLIVDVPSLDRTHDEGRLTAHRVFFGLPPGSTQLSAAARAEATITEFAFVPDELPDGAYLLQLQAPALAGDAVPSRPLLYPLLPPASP